MSFYDGVIEVTVQNGVTNELISGASVTLTDIATSTSLTLATDYRGVVRYEGLSSSRYNLEVNLDGFIGYASTFGFSSLGNPLQVLAILYPGIPGHALQVFVRDPEFDVPVFSAKVRVIDSNNYARELTTETFGFVAFSDLPSGTYTVTASKPGWNSDSLVVTLGQTANEAVSLYIIPNDIKLEVQKPVNGQIAIITPDGTTEYAPYTVYIHPGFDFTLQVNPNSSYNFDHWEVVSGPVLTDDQALSNPLTINHTEPITIKAVLLQDPEPTNYTVTFVKPIEAEYMNPVGSVTVPENSIIQVSCSPKEGYVFTNYWETPLAISHQGDGSSDNRLDYVVTRNATITPMFTSGSPPGVLRTLTIQLFGEGTTDPSPGVHNYYDAVNETVQVILPEGYEVAAWVVDGVTLDHTAISIPILMNTSHVIKVTTKLSGTNGGGGGGTSDLMAMLPYFAVGGLLAIVVASLGKKKKG